MTALRERLESLRACQDAIDWVGDRDLATAWRDCQRGDWMLWLAGWLAGPPMSDRRRPLTLAACECARLALKHLPAGENRPLAAIETAERWARGDDTVTVQMITAAYDAADAADDAAYAAYDAAYAAAYDAAYAADAVAAAAAAARIDTLARCADIVRKHYPTPPEMP